MTFGSPGFCHQNGKTKCAPADSKREEPEKCDRYPIQNTEKRKTFTFELDNENYVLKNIEEIENVVVNEFNDMYSKYVDISINSVEYIKNKIKNVAKIIANQREIADVAVVVSACSIQKDKNIV